MALFFDRGWFDNRLRELSLGRDIVAGALQLSEEQVSEVWKDQRELSAGQVSVLAHLLDVSVEEIAHHGGVSTPLPSAPQLAAQGSTVDAGVDPGEMAQVLSLLSHMNDRMARLEAEVKDLRKLMQGIKDA